MRSLRFTRRLLAGAAVLAVAALPALAGPTSIVTTANVTYTADGTVSKQLISSLTAGVVSVCFQGNVAWNLGPSTVAPGLNATGTGIYLTAGQIFCIDAKGGIGATSNYATVSSGTLQVLVSQWAGS